jgi:thiol-disulfide isomerase/thioredoxin
VGITARRRFAASLAAAALILTAPPDCKVRAADTALKAWTGQRLPPFALDTLAGSRTDLGELRGHIVLVHFFATWCEPCRAEFASLQQLVGRMQARPLAVVAVDAGEADRAVQHFFATSAVSDLA